MSYCLLAEDMAALIEAVGLEQPLACGYATAAKSGWRWGYTTLVWRAYVVSGAIYMWPDTYLPMFKRIGLTGPDEVDYAKVATDALLLDLLHASSMWLTPWHYADDELSKIGEPTLLLASDRDEIFMPVEQAVHLYRPLPRAELAVLPDAAHFFVGAQSELFSALVLDFRRRQSTGTE